MILTVGPIDAAGRQRLIEEARQRERDEKWWSECSKLLTRARWLNEWEEDFLEEKVANGSILGKFSGLHAFAGFLNRSLSQRAPPYSAPTIASTSARSRERCAVARARTCAPTWPASEPPS